jgi:hypothetical protein
MKNKTAQKRGEEIILICKKKIVYVNSGRKTTWMTKTVLFYALALCARF